MKQAYAGLAAGVACLAAASATPAIADSIFELEHARAMERSGRYLTDRNIELLDRYGGNDDYRWRHRHQYYEVYEPYPVPRRYRRHHHYDD